MYIIYCISLPDGVFYIPECLALFLTFISIKYQKPYKEVEEEMGEYEVFKNCVSELYSYIFLLIFFFYFFCISFFSVSFFRVDEISFLVSLVFFIKKWSTSGIYLKIFGFFVGFLFNSYLFWFECNFQNSYRNIICFFWFSARDNSWIYIYFLLMQFL